MHVTNAEKNQYLAIARKMAESGELGSGSPMRCNHCHRAGTPEEFRQVDGAQCPTCGHRDVSEWALESQYTKEAAQ